MPESQMVIVASLVTVVLWCSLAGFQHARRGRTYHALAYLLIASVPFLAAAIRADTRQPGKHFQIVERQQLMRDCWLGSAQSLKKCSSERHN
jgi:hypothetical protein